MVGKYNTSRMLNFIKSEASFYRAQMTGNMHHPAMPVSISIEPTTACNLRCPECPSGLRSFTRPTGLLNMELFVRIIEQIHRQVGYLTFYFQGEPYLHQQFLQMVQFASQHGMYTATSTNAHFLDDALAVKTVEAGLNRLIISIDGTSQETYEKYRVGGSINKVFKAIDTICRIKKELKKYTPYVILQFLVVRHNEHQIQEIIRIARSSGVNELRFKTAQVYDYKNGNDLIPTIEKYSRYRINNDGTYSIKNEMKNNCRRLWKSCVITWDGNVLPCCFDKDGKYVMGNIAEKNFSEIWNNSNYEWFRKSLFTNRKGIDICTNCSEGTSVWS
ncbi:MAG: SPASM domain-containing protein [Bacteroidetes bacterium]|nr:SPASM domain-containing protein [Bacteroidota bacterium]